MGYLQIPDYTTDVTNNFVAGTGIFRYFSHSVVNILTFYTLHISSYKCLYLFLKPTFLKLNFSIKKLMYDHQQLEIVKRYMQ